MKVSEVGLIIYYSLLCCAIHGSSNGQANAENILENNPESISNEDTPQFHSENHERRHLLAHLADRMDLDGEGLRHIQKHLGEVTGESIQNQDVNDVAAGDNAKGIFYFFKLHDYDDNQKLDGLEWMQALTDFHQQDDDKGEFKEGGRMFLEHEAEAIVDELLTKHDMDDDGMIDFFELMNSKVNSFMTDLDKGGEVPEGDEQQQQQNDEQKSSLEQEFNQHQQDQQPTEQNQAQQEDKPQEHQQQDHQQQDQQGQQEHQQQADQQQQGQQLQADQQQDQQEHQQQDNHNKNIINKNLILKKNDKVNKNNKTMNSKMHLL
ncbi:hypothetical protein OS493_009589 [Desmophyllum pertusum]|uniref:EF-hand domain-containing protein n=1 Tax=Desmophyllum pertusum TaxID=174260 RepID=A0A9W9YQY7_9CNID|nr:hypothetical protein OS493_009589 [Desmophyllum pertusum]